MIWGRFAKLFFAANESGFSMAIRISSRDIRVDYIQDLFKYKQKTDKEQGVIIGESFSRG
jgi:hypothetical protein